MSELLTGWTVRSMTINYDGGLSGSVQLQKTTGIIPWTVEFYNGTGSSSARYEVEVLEDPEGDFTWRYWFKKVGGWGNVDFNKTERLSDGLVVDGGSSYVFTGEGMPSKFGPSTHDPSSLWDGKTSHRLWVTNGNGINQTADTYIQFNYGG